MTATRAAMVGMALLAGASATADEPVPSTEREKLSYGVGVSMARTLQRQGVEADAHLTARGIEDVLAGRKLVLDEEELRAAMGRFRAEARKNQVRRQPTAAEARAQEEAFLAENARKEGVVSLPSGLQYRVLRQGDGRTPTDGDRVVCQYRGTFVDGTEFDSSHRRGRPAIFEMARVIPGWNEALKLMAVGSRWELFIPSKLAYGELGARGRKRTSGVIGPNATLIYETELLEIQPGRGRDATRTEVGPTATAVPPAEPRKM